MRTALLTVAVLMATATYQAGLSPPGGVWQDGHLDKNGTLMAPARASMMGTRNQIMFFLFMVGNSLGFYTSLYVIMSLTDGFPLQLELQASLFATSLTYVASTHTIAPNLIIGWVFFAISIVLPILIALVYNKC